MGIFWGVGPCFEEEIGKVFGLWWNFGVMGGGNKGDDPLGLLDYRYSLEIYVYWLYENKGCNYRKFRGAVF